MSLPTSLKYLLFATILSAPLSALGNKNIEFTLDAKHRSAENQARDHYRHPEETLRFMGLQADMNVLEIWPGGGAWYTEILAPYLKDKGQLYLADVFKSDTKLKTKINAAPDIFGQTKLVSFDPTSKEAIMADASVDMVLTFRNTHNWYMRDGGIEKLTAAFTRFYAVLKPNGILGVVDHRLPEDADDALQVKSGYLKQSTVIKAASAAGFELVDQSEINANPKDTAIHPKGVWTLPPSLKLGDVDKEKYLDIGESDRMTLKFVKKNIPDTTKLKSITP